MKVIIPVGFPGCGKSTLCARLKAQDPHLVVVCPDEVRFQKLATEHTGIDFNPHIEKDVWRTVERLLGKALKTGHDVFFDATNLTRARRDFIISRARARGYQIHIHEFCVPLEVCWERQRQRKRKVPISVLKVMRRAREPVHMSEWDLYSMEVGS